MVAIDKGNPYFNIIFVFAQSSSFLFSCFGKLLYIVTMSSSPVNPASKKDRVYPTVAPNACNPIITSEGIRSVLITDCIISITLLSSILSIPVKAA